MEEIHDECVGRSEMSVIKRQQVIDRLTHMLTTKWSRAPAEGGGGGGAEGGGGKGGVRGGRGRGHHWLHPPSPPPSHSRQPGSQRQRSQTHHGPFSWQGNPVAPESR